VSGDKSISHRAVLLAALSPDQSRLRGVATALDCRASVRAAEQLGAAVVQREGELLIRGAPELSGGEVRIDCGRSGTTMRLLAGILAARKGASVLLGDPQLLARPMERVCEPLRAMGAVVETAPGGRAPLRILGGGLAGVRYRLPVASAQVKSAVLLAGLRAEGRTVVEEPVPTRDHTERLLLAMGAGVETGWQDGVRSIGIVPTRLAGLDLEVPGDASSAAVLAAAAALVPGSCVTVRSVSANPTRTAFLRLLAEMGAVVEVGDTHNGAEAAADVTVRQRPLLAVEVGPDLVPLLVDELPLLGLLATQAEGTTVVEGAGELRFKEVDRISGLTEGLRRLGASVAESRDGFAVSGPTRLHGGEVDSRGDHRLAMVFSLAALVSEGEVTVAGTEFIGDSFPEFGSVLRSLQ
jgi:3-phosphoshikimate 1-carboxyvinyltransferase